MTLEQNIRAVLETCFSESKEEIQENALNNILELIKYNDDTSIPRDKIREFHNELIDKAKIYGNIYYSEIACEINEKFL